MVIQPPAWDHDTKWVVKAELEFKSPVKQLFSPQPQPSLIPQNKTKQNQTNKT